MKPVVQTLIAELSGNPIKYYFYINSSDDSDILEIISYFMELGDVRMKIIK